MRAESEGSVGEAGKELESVQREARTCPVCGTKFFTTANSGFCPVCILRGAAGEEATAAEVAGSVSGSASQARFPNPFIGQPESWFPVSESLACAGIH